MGKPSFRYKKLEEYLFQVEHKIDPSLYFGPRSTFGSETYSLYEYRLPNSTGVRVIVDSLGCVFCQLFLYNESGEVTHEDDISSFWSKQEAGKYVENFVSTSKSKMNWAETQRRNLDPSRPKEYFLDTLSKGTRKIYEYYESRGKPIL